MSAARTCPVCEGKQTRVYDSRPSADGEEILRRVRCSTCDSRWSTFERFERMIVIEGKRVSRAQKKSRPSEPVEHHLSYGPVEITGGGRARSLPGAD